MKKEGYEFLSMDSANPVGTISSYSFYNSERQLVIGILSADIGDNCVTVRLSPPQTEYYEYY